MSMTPDDMKKGLSGVFSRAAKDYDKVGPQFFRYFAENLPEEVSDRKEIKVLDVACGRGANLMAILEKTGRDGQGVGIDLSEKMIELNRKEFQEKGFGNVQFQVMDAESLDFPDSSFDLVICGFALFFFPNLEKSLAEIYRVLAPGGQFVASTWSNESENLNWTYEIYRDLLPPLPSIFEALGKEEGLLEVVKKAEFREVKIHGLEKKFFYRDELELWNTQWTHGARGLLENLPQEDLEKLKKSFLTEATRFKEKEGIRAHLKALYAVGRK